MCHAARARQTTVPASHNRPSTGGAQVVRRSPQVGGGSSGAVAGAFLAAQVALPAPSAAETRTYVEAAGAGGASGAGAAGSQARGQVNSGGVTSLRRTS